MAGFRVISEPDLYLNILLNVDPKTLLLSQRVCKTFRDTIITNVTIQEKLFMRE